MGFLLGFLIGSWFILFFRILLNYPAPVKKEQYFPGIIKSYSVSKLRRPWKIIYLALTYSVGILCLMVWKSAEYPVIGLKKTIKFILFPRENKNSKQKGKKDEANRKNKKG